MAVTAQSLINKSLRLLGVLASGETTTADEAQDSLYSLNSIIDSFSANPQYYFCTQAEQFTLVNGQNTYTIGNDPSASPPANFVTTRPIRIVGAFVRVSLSPRSTCRRAINGCLSCRWRWSWRPNMAHKLSLKLSLTCALILIV